MANYYLTRNPVVSVGPDNISSPTAKQFRWVSLTYGGVTGGQDVIFTPDAEKVGVQVFIVGGFTYSVEGTCDTPAVVEAGSASWTPITGWKDITTSNIGSIDGTTALRINPSVAGTSVKINVRA